MPAPNTAAEIGREHTPGPWRWEVSRSSFKVELCGGNPKGGYGAYDLTVMSFKRWGIQSAQPEFWDWNQERCVGTPLKASEIAEPVPGREHHERWFRAVNHPDARLIAAAPELLDALDAIQAAYLNNENPFAMYTLARSAALKAQAVGEGESPCT